ncbi:hypothetical protein HanIR_Chr12g0614721 [Helianthus annuus]|nr:hypothetical protein HanIR_Chr12g0614721 [Helianthus annuus]
MVMVDVAGCGCGFGCRWVGIRGGGGQWVLGAAVANGCYGRRWRVGVRGGSTGWVVNPDVEVPTICPKGEKGSMPHTTHNS